SPATTGSSSAGWSSSGSSSSVPGEVRSSAGSSTGSSTEGSSSTGAGGSSVTSFARSSSSPTCASREEGATVTAVSSSSKTGGGNSGSIGSGSGSFSAGSGSGGGSGWRLGRITRTVWPSSQPSISSPSSSWITIFPLSSVGSDSPIPSRFSSSSSSSSARVALRDPERFLLQLCCRPGEVGPHRRVLFPQLRPPRLQGPGSLLGGLGLAMGGGDDLVVVRPGLGDQPLRFHLGGAEHVFCLSAGGCGEPVGFPLGFAHDRQRVALQLLALALHLSLHLFEELGAGRPGVAAHRLGVGARLLERGL